MIVLIDDKHELGMEISDSSDYVSPVQRDCLFATLKPSVSVIITNIVPV